MKDHFNFTFTKLSGHVSCSFIDPNERTEQTEQTDRQIDRATDRQMERKSMKESYIFR